MDNKQNIPTTKYSEQFKEYHINKIIRSCEFCGVNTTDLNKPVCNECAEALKELVLEQRKKKSQ